MATIKDVAAKANVSISTVSYVLNNKKNVRVETYNRVMGAVKDLGYQPNMLARGLRTKESKSIGVLIADISNMYFTDIVLGIEKKANSLGYSTIICNTENNPENEKKYLKTLINKNIDALVIVTSGSCFELLKDIKDTPIAFVDSTRSDEYNYVWLDNQEGGYIATKHLIDKGRRKIAIISGPASLYSSLDRTKGYKKALSENNIPYSENRFVETQFTYSGGYDATKELLRRGIEFDAVFANNDLIAMGCIRALYEKGIKVPSDVSVIGFDDIEVTEIFIPALSTIKQPRFKMGKRVAKIVIDRINNPDAPNAGEVFIPELVVRETS